jgi:uncharacterized protein YbjT (DUF2867 family)
MSQVSARRIAISHASRDHWIAERMLDRSGIPVTHLRPTLFAEWLKYFAPIIKETSILPLPFCNVRYAPVAGEDLGRVIAAIFNDPGKHCGKSYPLYGPKELSQYEIADILTRVLERKIAYVPSDIEAFQKILKERGYTVHFQQHVGGIAEECLNGVFSGTNDLVEKLTGRKPLEMTDYIVKNKAMFS